MSARSTIGDAINVMELRVLVRRKIDMRDEEFDFTNIKPTNEGYMDGLYSIDEQQIINLNNIVGILSKRLREAAKIIYDEAQNKGDLVREAYEHKASFYQTLADIAIVKRTEEDVC